MNGKLEHLFDMEYLKGLLEKHKEDFAEQEIYNEQDLENYLLATMKSNVSYDFNIQLELEKLFGRKVTAWDKSPYEIAECLYECAKDMDYGDYEDTKEIDMAHLEQAVYHLKSLAEYNDDFKLLYTMLERLN